MSCKQTIGGVNTSTARGDRYRVFVLTCWIEESDDLGDSDSWRFRFEEPRSDLRRGCVGIQRLAALLCNEIAEEVACEPVDFNQDVNRDQNQDVDLAVNIVTDSSIDSTK